VASDKPLAVVWLHTKYDCRTRVEVEVGSVIGGTLARRHSGGYRMVGRLRRNRRRESCRSTHGETQADLATSERHPVGQCPSMEMHCADCGCLVDRGEVVERCSEADCCCANLPDKQRDPTRP
jgi:hypothetical protein